MTPLFSRLLSRVAAVCAMVLGLSLPSLLADQTVSYPSASSPDFTIDFPDDWNVESDGEGAYVESPDKIVAINILFIDADEVDVAVGRLKKSVGGKFQQIEWDGGKEPEVNKDEALGLTATFHNGLAINEGVKYSVNIVEYVRAKGDKFLVLISQLPIKGLDEHADDLEKIIRSIKVR